MRISVENRIYRVMATCSSPPIQNTAPRNPRFDRPGFNRMRVRHFVQSRCPAPQLHALGKGTRISDAYKRELLPECSKLCIAQRFHGLIEVMLWKRVSYLGLQWQ